MGNRDEVQDMLSKDISEEAFYRAIDDRSLESKQYGPITLEYENNVKAETDYILEFGDDETIRLKFRSGHNNKHFYFLEALSQGFNVEKALEATYNQENNIRTDILGALDDSGTLKTNYLEPLSNLLEEEFWQDEENKFREDAERL